MKAIYIFLRLIEISLLAFQSAHFLGRPIVTHNRKRFVAETKSEHKIQSNLPDQPKYRLSRRLREVAFTRIEPQMSHPRKGPSTSTLCKIIYCMQCVS